MVNLLGRGVLLEPLVGSTTYALAAPYKPEHGRAVKEAGFQSVRIRFQSGDIQRAETEQPLDKPYDQGLFRQMAFIVDDLLARDLGEVLTFFGVRKHSEENFKRTIRWWKTIADYFQNRSHRLVFNLFVEPYALQKSAGDAYLTYVRELCRTIRKTNPTRTIILYHWPPAEADPWGAGDKNFMRPDGIPEEAGRYVLLDFHVLKPDLLSNVYVIRRAVQWRANAARGVWVGAWGISGPAKRDKPFLILPFACGVNRALTEAGIPSAYLMMYNGGFSIYDPGTDRDGNGKANHWFRPELVKAITSGPSIWWNLLDNPGFEHGKDGWGVAGARATLLGAKGPDGSHALVIANAGNQVRLTQDLTAALKNNGPGEYDVLGHFYAEGPARVKFLVAIKEKGRAGGRSFESNSVTLRPKRWQLVRGKIGVDWRGALAKAELVIAMKGTASVRIDNVGLTQFCREPRLSTEIWPGAAPERKLRAINNPWCAAVDFNRALRSATKKIARTDAGLRKLVKHKEAVQQEIDAWLATRIPGYPANAGDRRIRKRKKSLLAHSADGKRFSAKLARAENAIVIHVLKNGGAIRQMYLEIFGALPPEVSRRAP